MIDPSDSNRSQNASHQSHLSTSAPATIQQEHLIQMWTFAAGDKVVFFRPANGDDIPSDYTHPELDRAPIPNDPSDADQPAHSVAESEGKSKGSARYRHGISPQQRTLSGNFTKAATDNAQTGNLFPVEKIPTAISATVTATITSGNRRVLELSLDETVADILPDSVTGAAIQFVDPLNYSESIKTSTEEINFPLPVLKFRTEDAMAPADRTDVPPVATTMFRRDAHGSPEQRNPLHPHFLGKISYMRADAYALLHPSGKISLRSTDTTGINTDGNTTKVKPSSLTLIERLPLEDFREFIDRGVIHPKSEQAANSIKKV